MGKHIPGQPNVIVQHQPGAGGLIASNAVYNTLPKDGTVLHTPNGGMTRRIVLGEPQARLDPRKWNWLGGWSEPINDCTVWSNSPATTLEPWSAAKCRASAASSKAGRAPSRSG